MIGISIRELSMLKVLDPIIMYFVDNKIPYNVYYYDVRRPGKEYNRASPANINLSNTRILKHSKKHCSFGSNKDLLNKLKKDGVSKFVSVEIALCHPEHSWGNIKTYSIQYLSDSIWRGNNKDYSNIYKIYFSSIYLRDIALKFANVKLNANRHMSLGSPLFDSLHNIGSGNNTLVLLPNLKVEHAKSAFDNQDNFFKIMHQLSTFGPMIYKTRRKQWLPEQIKKYASEIIYDGSKMFPGTIIGALNKCNKVVIFNSSGIYECIMANKRIFNIKIPINRWSWNSKKMNEYFSYNNDSLYEWKGVVTSLNQKDLIDGKVKLDNNLDSIRLNGWKNKFIGINTNNSAINIAKDIIST